MAKIVPLDDDNGYGTRFWTLLTYFLSTIKGVTLEQRNHFGFTTAAEKSPYINMLIAESTEDLGSFAAVAGALHDFLLDLVNTDDTLTPQELGKRLSEVNNLKDMIASGNGAFTASTQYQTLIKRLDAIIGTANDGESFSSLAGLQTRLKADRLARVTDSQAIAAIKTSSAEASSAAQALQQLHADDATAYATLKANVTSLVAVIDKVDKATASTATVATSTKTLLDEERTNFTRLLTNVSTIMGETATIQGLAQTTDSYSIAIKELASKIASNQVTQDWYKSYTLELFGRYSATLETLLMSVNSSYTKWSAAAADSLAQSASATGLALSISECVTALQKSVSGLTLASTLSEQYISVLSNASTVGGVVTEMLTMVGTLQSHIKEMSANTTSLAADVATIKKTEAVLGAIQTAIQGWEASITERELALKKAQAAKTTW